MTSPQDLGGSTKTTGSDLTVSLLTQTESDSPCTLTATVSTINLRPSSSQAITVDITNGVITIKNSDYTHSGNYDVTFTIALESGTTNSNFPVEFTLTWEILCMPSS